MPYLLEDNMNTITATFEVKIHEEFGIKGLAMVGRNWADPYDGMAVAHDILEHGVDDTGTQEEELMALGATFYVRNMDAYYDHKGKYVTDLAIHIASDMLEQVHIMHSTGKQHWDDPGRVRLCDPHIEDTLTVLVSEVKKLMHSEFDRFSDVPPAFREAIEFTKMKRWLRKGYHRAVKQYAALQPYQVCNLFEEIEKKADHFLKHAEPYGAQCKITVDLEKRTITLQEIYPEDPYDE
jgi:hypothetical protein